MNYVPGGPSYNYVVLCSFICVFVSAYECVCVCVCVCLYLYNVATPVVGGCDSQNKRSSRVAVQRFYYVQLTKEKAKSYSNLGFFHTGEKGARGLRFRSVGEVSVAIAPGFWRSVRDSTEWSPTRLPPSGACPAPLPSPSARWSQCPWFPGIAWCAI